MGGSGVPVQLDTGATKAIGPVGDSQSMLMAISREEARFSEFFPELGPLPQRPAPGGPTRVEGSVTAGIEDKVATLLADTHSAAAKPTPGGPTRITSPATVAIDEELLKGLRADSLTHRRAAMLHPEFLNKGAASGAGGGDQEEQQEPFVVRVGTESHGHIWYQCSTYGTEREAREAYEAIDLLEEGGYAHAEIFPVSEAANRICPAYDSLDNHWDRVKGLSVPDSSDTESRFSWRTIGTLRGDGEIVSTERIERQTVGKSRVWLAEGEEGVEEIVGVKEVTERPVLLSGEGSRRSPSYTDSSVTGWPPSRKAASSDDSPPPKNRIAQARKTLELADQRLKGEAGKLTIKMGSGRPPVYRDIH